MTLTESQRYELSDWKAKGYRWVGRNKRGYRTALTTEMYLSGNYTDIRSIDAVIISNGYLKRDIKK